MAKETKPLSTVVPHLSAAIICDVACRDPSTGKSTLVGLFNKITVAKFPTQRPISLFLRVTDAQGYYEFEVKFVQVLTGKQMAAAQGQIQFNDPSGSVELNIAFPPLPIPKEGRYEFQIWTNSMYLGSTCIDAVPTTGS